MTRLYDLGVIGGGINGVGIARDAAGRGLSVVLLEQDDLAGATSSSSTKLIHGGLRYLEQFAFRLVRESLTEREVLWRAAPHIIGPLRFVLPHHPGLRPWWMIRSGLLLYDHLGGRKILPPTRVLDLRRDPAGEPLRGEFIRACEYSDCWVDDARLVVLNAHHAATLGADIRTRVRCCTARPEDGLWRLTLAGGAEICARVLVNAGGPFASHVLTSVIGQTTTTPVRLVKGSHIVVPRLYTHDRCYVFQNTDARVCFAIPYHEDFTLIGTTDEDYAGDPADAVPSAIEAQYLCDAVNRYLRLPLGVDSIVWRYSGVRTLRGDHITPAQDATREYVLELRGASGTAPVLSVFGGKLTTYRRLAEAVMARLRPFFPDMGSAWTSGAPLPGGDFPCDGVDALCSTVQRRYPFLTADSTRRLVRTYGTLASDVLGDSRDATDLGRIFGADLAEREVDYLRRCEWAVTAEDVLWRRTKLGLRLSPTEVRTLDKYLARSPSVAHG